MTSKAKFNVGDLVILKSGGPVMTVTKVYDRTLRDEPIEYTCAWFSGKKNENAHFPQDALNPAPKDEK
jgi:uncharacterized protein YodC (DUF2158 family)